MLRAEGFVDRTTSTPSVGDSAAAALTLDAAGSGVSCVVVFSSRAAGLLDSVNVFLAVNRKCVGDEGVLSTEKSVDKDGVITDEAEGMSDDNDDKSAVAVVTVAVATVRAVEVVMAVEEVMAAVEVVMAEPPPPTRPTASPS